MDTDQSANKTGAERHDSLAPRETWDRNEIIQHRSGFVKPRPSDTG
jgi:hypothetical protein